MSEFRLKNLNPHRVGLIFWLLGLLTLAGVGLMAGCTSDLPNEVGTVLVNDHIDVVLEPLGLEQVQQYTAKNVSDAEVPLLDQQALYLGAQEGNESSLLLNYDFSNVYSDSFPEEAWTNENITSVELRLVMIKYYGNLNEVEEEEEEKSGADKALGKYYQIFQLDEPFDGGSFPGPEPGRSPIDLNINSELDISKEPHLQFSKPYLVSWVAAGEQVGLTVREGPGSEDGMTAFASTDLTLASELESIHADPGAAPVFLVQFAHTDSVAYIEPTADISTFHSVSEAPLDVNDGLMMRTCLRTYPMLLFDFSELPRNAFINRATLAVSNDTTRSFGNLQSIVVSEIDTRFFGVPGDTMPLADLENAVYSLSGMSSLDATYNTQLEFNITTGVQRIINEVYEGERAFILTAGEDFFPGYDLDAVDPDFYLTQFNFFGSAATDTLRPRLKISYSLVDDIDGGE